MEPKKLLSCSALTLGLLIFMAGVGFVFAYISEAVLARLGEPDQSLLFWYSPFLFLGIIGVALGLGIGILGWIALRKLRQPDAKAEDEERSADGLFHQKPSSDRGGQGEEKI